MRCVTAKVFCSRLSDVKINVQGVGIKAGGIEEDMDVKSEWC